MEISSVDNYYAINQYQVNNEISSAPSVETEPAQEPGVGEIIDIIG